MLKRNCNMSQVDLKKVIKSARQLEAEEQLQLISELTQSLRQTLKKPSRHKLMDLAGVGAQLWRNVDVDKYLNKERDSWDLKTI